MIYNDCFCIVFYIDWLEKYDNMYDNMLTRLQKVYKMTRKYS